MMWSWFAETSGGIDERRSCDGEELKMKVEELRLLIVEKLAELEEDAKWGTPDER